MAFFPLTCWLPSWLTCWLTCWLPSWLTCWLPSWLPLPFQVRSDSLIRFMVFSVAAYGATGLNYYCWGGGIYFFSHDFNLAGKPSPVYPLVAEINADVGAWGDELLAGGFRVIALGLLACPSACLLMASWIPPGCLLTASWAPSDWPPLHCSPAAPSLRARCTRAPSRARGRMEAVSLRRRRL